jgi:tight adherence protein B
VARLPVLLVLPVGLCLLPAAILLGVVPVVLDLLGDVLAGV